MRKRQGKKRGPKVTKKALHEQRKTTKLNPSGIRKWITDNEEDVGTAKAMFRCSILDRCVAISTCAVGSCKDDGGRSCPFFKDKDAQQALIDHSLETGKMDHLLYQIVEVSPGKYKFVDKKVFG